MSEQATEAQLLESIVQGLAVLQQHPGFTGRPSKNCFHRDEPCTCLHDLLSQIDDEVWELIGADAELTRAANGFGASREEMSNG